MTDQEIEPHEDPDECPEEHIGEEIRDPWEDPENTFWPTETVETDGTITPGVSPDGPVA